MGANDHVAAGFSRRSGRPGCRIKGISDLKGLDLKMWNDSSFFKRFTQER